MDKIKKLKFLFISILFFGLSGNAQAMVFPGADWQTATPASQGVDQAALQNALNYFQSQTNYGVGIGEMVIVRNGYVIWEGSQARTANHILYSATKTFTTTILGKLIQNGNIGSVDDPAVNYLPTLDDQYPVYSGITFRQMASMTSGYDGVYGGSLYDCWDEREHGNYAAYDQCVANYTTPGPPLSNPGTAFKYHDPNVHMLGKILTQRAGMPLKQYFQENIAGPIGITSFNWTDYGVKNFGSAGNIIFNNPAGTPGGLSQQGGVSIRPIDLARYGLLYLNRGNWNGQQILDASWVDQATINQVSNSLGYIAYDRRGRFGFMWWTNGIGPSGQRPWPAAPAKTFTAIGASQNYCFVIPEWNMVIVRMAPPEEQTNMGSNVDTIMDGFFNRLAAGVSEIDTTSPAAPSGLSVN